MPSSHRFSPDYENVYSSDPTYSDSGGVEPGFASPPTSSIPIAANHHPAFSAHTSTAAAYPHPFFTTTPSGLQSPLSRKEWFFLLLRATVFWVMVGILLMAAGTLVVKKAIVPSIIRCWDIPICVNPDKVDPSLNILGLIQSFVQYLFQIGILISGLGLTKLIACQSCLSIGRTDTTIEVLELNMGAINGRLKDSVQLLLKSRNYSLGAFALASIAIFNSISLIVGLSIPTPTLEQTPFEYATRFRLPAGDARGNVTHDQEMALNQLEVWLRRRDRDHGLPYSFPGSLVLKGDRLTVPGSFPNGNCILSDVSCSADGITTSISRLADDSVTYNISLQSPSTSFQINDSYQLATHILNSALPSATQQGRLHNTHLWISNFSDVFLDTQHAAATQTADGKYSVSVCNHTVWMEKCPSRLFEEITFPQFIEPSSPSGSAPSEDGNMSLLVSAVLNLLTVSWNSHSDPSRLTRIYYQPVVLEPWSEYGNELWNLSAADRSLSYLWSGTSSAMLDALVQTAQTSEDATQYLWVQGKELKMARLWLQGLIPIAVLVLYVTCLAYTVYLHPGREMKKITLLEVVKAAVRTEEVAVLAQNGGLTKSTRVSGSPAPSFSPASRDRFDYEK